ncbi:mitotic checkpoint serine/threonine-protein kinase BUB1 [Colossoma macropomum]|uniref:mitotic checkpoint serine/threonine-protein kinase BUB1 n=1 Tax=Colossoma macropomum TaxID=42526 RepID=UPI00186423D9|nr:mitotic checkpoint serine/threonine-protein kinase BUB1 [Colossoma macropomum]
MDINFYLQGFEDSVSSYAGDDPLDPWDKFVEFLDCRMAEEEKSGLVVVLERLVQRFLQDKRYNNDPRYIRHCISWASYYSEPIKLYSYVHSRGVGARAAPLYVAWAQHFERKGLIPQAEQVYQRAIENQAEPLDTVQQQYRLFQSRTAKSPAAPSDHVRNPLQNSQLVNQSLRQRETLQSQCKEPENSPADRTVRIVSRSENNPKPSSCSSSVECVSMYCVKELECEGSELSFEELRARRYFTKCRQQELQRKQEEAIRRWEEEEEEVVRMKKLLEELNSKLSTEEQQENQNPPSQQELIGAESYSTQDTLDRSVRPALTPTVPEVAAPRPVCGPEQPSLSFMGLQPAPERPLLSGRKSESHLLWSSAKVPASRLSLSLSAASRAQLGFSAAAASPSDSDTHAAALLRPADQRAVSQAERSVLEGCAQNPAASERDTSEHVEADGDANADTSHGAFNHSHVTPNTSLGLISATPSRALPSPTVNTREALDVIMDMFQAPTLLQDTLFNTTSHAANDSFEKNCRVTGFAPPSAKPPSAPFRIYQDENGESRREEVEKTRPAARALMEIPVSKPNDTPVGVESLTDESAMWGPRYASITACPNHTRDFAMSAHLVSTPLHPTAPYTWDTEHNQENRGFSGTDENPYQRQPAKLSPILEQSPSEEKPSEAAECSLRAQGTIVGEGVSLPQQNQTLSQTHNQTSCSMSRNPLAPLALHDHTAEPSRALSSTTKPSWSIYQSPDRTGQMESNREPLSSSMHSVREPKPDQLSSTGLQVNSSFTTKPSWSIYQSPERTSLTGSNGELHSNSMHLVREPKPDQLNSTGLQVNSSFSSKPSWSIYQGPERTSHTGSNGELHSNSMHLVREPKPDQLSSTGLQVNSTFTTKPSWNIYQGPERTSQTGSSGELHSNSMHLVREPKPDQLNSTGLQVNSSFSSKPSWNIYQGPERTSQTGSSGELHSNSMHLVREPKPDQLNSTGLQVNSSFTTKPSWSIYQGPERTSHTGSNGELHSNSMHLVREPKPDQLSSTGLQVNSSFTTKPSWSIYQGPERTSHRSSNREHTADQLSSAGLQVNGVLNSSSLHLATELRPDQPNSSGLQPLGVDACSGQGEADLLLPKRSFHRRKSEKQQNREIHQDVPMSPEPAPGFSWLQVDSPAQLAEPDLDVMVRSMVRSPQTYGTTSGSLAAGSKPSWSVYQSPEKPSEPRHIPQSPEPMEESDHHPFPMLEQSGILLSKRSFNRRKSEKRVLEVVQKSLLSSPKQASNPIQDVPMSPEPVPGLNWLCAESPARMAEPDLDVLMTPPQTSKTSAVVDVPPAAHQLQGSGPDYTPSVLVSDPWDEDLIASLLSSLKTPLSSYPNLRVWTHSLPAITPKMTVQMAEESLRVDFVLGQGAFATVYQATNLTTSDKLILKVQKPPNPWEFYINSQLDGRVQPRARHLFNQLHSAHLFTNGSVLVGELHNCGTLLSMVNLYKSRSEKLMPAPLVLYFSVCILQMVEQLHRASIVHADIKPDNFLLGERFLENEDFDAENLDHGLVLIDFGQSIDMTLFPQGTAFTARCMTSGFQCTEMLSGRPWNYQTDYFGIAGTVYCMIFGSYMQVRNEGGVWKTNGVFKRNPHADLWQEFFHVLLNIPDCNSLPCLRRLRECLSAALLENYSNKLRSLKNRLVVQILEARSARR